MKKQDKFAVKIAMAALAVLICAGGAFADTPSVTPTITETVTETVTGTITGTITATFTLTVTVQQSLTFTPTFTMQETKTFTATATAQQSLTFTPTFTMQETKTFTATATAQQSLTFTPTFTMQDTGTFTPTSTCTPTVTVTSTVTPTVTVTLTPLPTATVIESYYDSLALTIYPNPVRTGDTIYMLYNFQPVTALNLCVYTLDGTQVISLFYTISGRGRLEASTAALAPGVYYYVVKSVSAGENSRTKTRKLLVLER